MIPLISAGVGALSSLAGAFLNRSAARDAAAENARVQAEQAERNRQMQLQFAKEGIRWKVDDARAAGIHPLYALGANTVSYSPVNVGQSSVADTSMGSALASAGQDVSRAINATRTSGERQTAFNQTVQDLQLSNMGLQNELLAAQIQKLRANANPPMPSISDQGPVPEEDKWGKIPKLIIGGSNVTTDKSTASMKEFSDRYGDEGLPQWAIAPYVMWRDYVSSVAANDEYARSNPFHRETRNPVRRAWVNKMLEWR